MHKITRAFGAAKLALQAKSPTIMVVGGVVLMAGSVVAAGIQSRKLDSAIEKQVMDLEYISTEPQDEIATQARVKAYGNITVECVKLYAVPAVLFVGGAGMTLYGHNILLQRNATLAIAFTTIKKSFDAYRARVVQLHGHQRDQRLLNGEATIGGGWIGEDPSQTYPSRNWEEAGDDPYNRVFAQGVSSQWENDLGTNKIFLGGQQRIAQQILNRRGYLYLSEVYTSLGFPESDVSRVVGWKIRTLPDGTLDIPVVDFGLDKPMPDDWKYGRNREVYLDFNCQGLIVGGKIQQMIESA